MEYLVEIVATFDTLQENGLYYLRVMRYYDSVPRINPEFMGEEKEKNNGKEDRKFAQYSMEIRGM